MKSTVLPTAVIVVGIGLFLFSFLWPKMAGTGTVWTEEQAEEYADAAADMHAALHERGESGAGHHGHAHGADDPNPAPAASFDEVKTRYDEAKAGLSHAQSVQRKPARFFKWAGVFCFALGVLGYYVVRGAA